MMVLSHHRHQAIRRKLNDLGGQRDDLRWRIAIARPSFFYELDYPVAQQFSYSYSCRSFSRFH